MSSPVALSAPVEWKVKAATAASYVGGVVGLALLQILSDGSLLSALPEPYTTLLAPLIPAAVTFIAGFITAHTPRSSGLDEKVDADIEQRVSAAMDKVVARVRIAPQPDGTARVETVDPDPAA